MVDNHIRERLIIVTNALDKCEKESDIRHILQLLRNVQRVRKSCDLLFRDAFLHLLPIISYSIIYEHRGVVDYWQFFVFWDGLFYSLLVSSERPLTHISAPPSTILRWSA